MTAKPQADRPLPRGEGEDARRGQLIEATIDTLAEVGFAATTLALIGQRAGVSPGLIAHYFKDKDGLLEATLRRLALRLSMAVSERLKRAASPRERVQAIVDATLAPEEFDQRTCSVWLAFWGEVIHSERLKRVQNVYQQRMLSNLRYGLRRLVSDADAERLAIAIAALIDGLWLRATLSSPHETDSRTAHMSTARSRGSPRRGTAVPLPSREACRASATISAAPLSPPPQGRRSPASIPRPARCSPRSRSPDRKKSSAP
jgi:betaine-aldehyde dehydrogenase